MKISIISSYGTIQLLPFGESMRDILVGSFGSLNINVKYYYLNEYSNNIQFIEQSDIVLFLMPPETYIKENWAIKKNNNKYILWNVEPTIKEYKDGTINKFTKRHEDLINILENDGYKVDTIWHYDYEQTDNRMLFVPIGYNKVLEPLKPESDRGSNKKQRIVLIGSRTKYRGSFFKVLKTKFILAKHKAWKVNVSDYTTYISNENLTDNVSNFNIGLDIGAYAELRHNVRWHRLVLYVACDLCILTNCDLSKYGFVKGIHYLYFDNTGQCETILSDIDKLNLDVIKKNAKNLVSEKFSMAKILKEALFNKKSIL